MYNSKPHQEHDLGRLHQHMLDTRLAVLVSHGDQGLLATHLPVLVDTTEGEFGTVYAHLARANRQWQDLAQGVEALLVFPGADAYVSPGYYPSKADNPKVVPTWNYLAVHAYGTAEVIHDTEPLLAIVSRLTDRHEQGRSEPWKVTDAPCRLPRWHAPRHRRHPPARRPSARGTQAQPEPFRSRHRWRARRP